MDLQKYEDDVAIEWSNKTDDIQILGVSASQEEGSSDWFIFVNVAEFVREEPLESKFRKLIYEALSKVNGVSSVEEDDREVWFVEGSAKGEELVTESVRALETIYSELKACMGDLVN